MRLRLRLRLESLFDGDLLDGLRFLDRFNFVFDVHVPLDERVLRVVGR